MTHLLPLSAVAETLHVLLECNDDPTAWPVQITIPADDLRGISAGICYLDRARIVGLRVCIPGSLPRVTSYPLADLAIDLSAPSVAARVAGLCARALYRTPSPAPEPLEWHHLIGRYSRCLLSGVAREPLDERDAAALAALFLALAPRIAALGGSHA